MTLLKIYAQLNCTDIQSSSDWYRALFARPNDVDPMDGLMEWHQGRNAGFQLVFNPHGAGRGSMTLIVSDLAGEHERRMKAGLEVGEILIGDFASFVKLNDPDGNTVVLAEPKGQT